MPNISTSNKNVIYKYTAEILTNFENDNNPIRIDFLRFRSIVVDYNYDKLNFPLFYCNVGIRREDAIKLAENQKNGTVIFTMWKYREDITSASDMKIEVLRKECIYFIPTDVSKESDAIIVDEDKSDDYGYRTTIGLIVLDHTNMNTMVRHGVINKGTMSSVLFYQLKDHQLIMEPLQHNPTLNGLMLPPLHTLSKMIGYLNNYSAFYDTMYKFFISFEATYLLSSSGKGVKKKGDRSNMVKFIIQNTYYEESIEGMTEKDDMYEIPCSASYCVLDDGSNNDKFFSGLEGITSNGGKEEKETGLRDKESKLIKHSETIRLPNNNTALLDNIVSEAANSAVVMTITKNKIDSTILTPNKQYYIDCTEVYGEQFTGTYLLSSKKEMYVPEGEGLAMSVILRMKKLANSEKTTS